MHVNRTIEEEETIFQNIEVSHALNMQLMSLFLYHLYLHKQIPCYINIKGYDS
jgi:hypothetical protein